MNWHPVGLSPPGGLSSPGGGGQAAKPDVYTGCFWAKLRLTSNAVFGSVELGFRSNIVLFRQQLSLLAGSFSKVVGVATDH